MAKKEKGTSAKSKTVESKIKDSKGKIIIEFDGTDKMGVIYTKVDDDFIAVRNMQDTEDLGTKIKYEPSPEEKVKTPDPIRVRITKCDESHFWYHKYVGKEFDVTIEDDTFYRPINSTDRSIYRSDCEVITPKSEEGVKEKSVIEKQIEQSRKIENAPWYKKQEEELIARLKKEQEDQFSREHDLLMEKSKWLNDRPIVLQNEKAINFPSLSEVKKFIEENEEMIGFDQNAKLFAINLYLWIKSR
jgi:hypothetical protein